NTRAYNYLQRLVEDGVIERIQNPILKRNLEILLEEMKPKHVSGLARTEAELTNRGNALEELYQQFDRNDEETVGVWTPPDKDQTYGELLLNLVRDRNQ